MRRFPGARTLSRTVWKAWDLLHGGVCRLDRPIFIVGCPRSGTTLLVRNFATHPVLADWSEALELWDPDRSDPQADHVKTEADATPELRRRVTAILSLYVWLRGAERLVNKLPRNALRISYLRALFPDCRIIHIIRDGRAVVGSLVRKARNEPDRHRFPLGRFAKPPGWRELLDLRQAEQFAHLWVRLVAHARSTGQAKPDSYTEVFYEDFCDDPRAVLGRLYQSCELKSHPRLADVPARFTSRNEGWRVGLTPTEEERVEEIVGPLLAQLGYEPSPAIGRPSQ